MTPAHDEDDDDAPKTPTHDDDGDEPAMLDDENVSVKATKATKATKAMKAMTPAVSYRCVALIVGLKPKNVKAVAQAQHAQNKQRNNSKLQRCKLNSNLKAKTSLAHNFSNRVA